jgi:hypothetical protein
MWLKDGDLSCDTCSEVFSHHGPHVIVLNAARGKGWHLFAGASLTGKQLDSHLCPACVGTARSSVTKVQRLVEDEPLF